MDSIVKTCLRCGPLTKEKVYFFKDGKRIECKSCNLMFQKLKREKNPEKIRAYATSKRYIERDPTINELKCTRCQTVKQLHEFHKYMFNIRSPYCRSCRNKITKEHHDKTESKEKHKKWYNEKYLNVARNNDYKRRYGITIDQYNQLLKKQNSVCAICKCNEPIKRKDGTCFLAIDHCHKTKQIRGLLCRKCNLGLGMFRENPDLISIVLKYLNRKL